MRSNLVIVMASLLAPAAIIYGLEAAGVVLPTSFFYGLLAVACVVLIVTQVLRLNIARRSEARVEEAIALERNPPRPPPPPTDETQSYAAVARRSRAALGYQKRLAAEGVLITRETEGEHFLTWLGLTGPDDWHAVVIGQNWDREDEARRVSLWVLAQPNCDRATAQALFGFFRAVEPQMDDTGGREAFLARQDPMVRAVLDRWEGAGFHRSEIALDRSEARAGAIVTYNAAVPQDGWTIPPDLAEPLDGRRVTSAIFAEGFPPEWIELKRMHGLG